MGLIFKRRYYNIFFSTGIENSTDLDLCLSGGNYSGSVDWVNKEQGDDALHFAKRRLHIFKCCSLETCNLPDGQR